ncbi:MAG: prolipoprotein diacylglyceryl transferase, partial [Acidobacteriota bacterium]|nr:prolipoprotein diacylglyceryl transferase [Acidobacteriota bacterium]
LYEAVFLGGLAYWLIRARRRGASDRAVIGQYFLLAGGFRFLLEFIRVNEQLLFGLTLAQMFALALAAAGALLLRGRVALPDVPRSMPQRRAR